MSANNNNNTPELGYYYRTESGQEKGPFDYASMQSCGSPRVLQIGSESVQRKRRESAKHRANARARRALIRRAFTHGTKRDRTEVRFSGESEHDWGTIS